MKTFHTFHELPLSAITPTGWMRNYLVTQKNGLTGNLEYAGYPFDTKGWASEIVHPRNPHGDAWWPYEQYGYWIDGLTRCGLLLNDSELLAKSREQINYVLLHQNSNGYLGPEHLKDNHQNNLWPHAVFLRSIMAECMSQPNKKTLKAVKKYAEYALDNLNTRINKESSDVFGLGDRNTLNIENFCFTAEYTDDFKLVDACEKYYSAFQELYPELPYIPKQLASDIPPEGHGVSYMEFLKIPVILYIYTGCEHYLAAARNGFNKLDYYHMLIDGAPSSCEELSGKQTNMVHETCVISDYIWTTGYMLQATGEVEWADKIERCFFNAGMGCVTSDFRAHQYYSSPNQVIADAPASHWNARTSWFDQSKGRMAYRPGHDTECCTGNLTRIAPNYMARMWLRTNDNGLAAALYGPSTVAAKVGPGSSSIIVHEKTNYPFDDVINFELFISEGMTKFSFKLRIPYWCMQPQIKINGKKISGNIVPGCFFTINREFSNGDVVALTLPSIPQKVKWPWNGIALEMGPLVYSLPINANTSISWDNSKSSEKFSAMEMTPAMFWAYALSSSEKEKVNIIKSSPGGEPWKLEQAPLKFEISALKLKNWELEQGHTPVLPGQLDIEQKENIILAPLGSTQLRMTIFPDSTYVDD